MQGGLIFIVIVKPFFGSEFFLPRVRHGGPNTAEQLVEQILVRVLNLIFNLHKLTVIWGSEVREAEDLFARIRLCGISEFPAKFSRSNLPMEDKCFWEFILNDAPLWCLDADTYFDCSTWGRMIRSTYFSDFLYGLKVQSYCFWNFLYWHTYSFCDLRFCFVLFLVCL